MIRGSEFTHDREVLSLRAGSSWSVMALVVHKSACEMLPDFAVNLFSFFSFWVRFRGRVGFLGKLAVSGFVSADWLVHCVGSLAATIVGEQPALVKRVGHVIENFSVGV